MKLQGLLIKSYERGLVSPLFQSKILTEHSHLFVSVDTISGFGPFQSVPHFQFRTRNFPVIIFIKQRFLLFIIPLWALT